MLLSAIAGCLASWKLQWQEPVRHVHKPTDQGQTRLCLHFGEESLQVFKRKCARLHWRVHCILLLEKMCGGTRPKGVNINHNKMRSI